ncbi:SHOCT domain-containing protein [Leifsonia sp. A12D58]|uniref:SHOCT domain-containing protein n=1 Tax=Leifsonia sp. A12D58 TaxID=3397674 RepID=UPI0039DF7D4F
MPMFRRAGRPGLVGMAARTAVVAGTATAVAGGVSRHQQNKANESAEAAQYEQQQAQQQAQAAQQQAPTQQTAAPSDDGGNVVAELERLAALHQQGVLNDQEFAAAKQKLLG